MGRLTRQEREEVHESVAEVAAALDHLPAFEDPWSVEQVALRLLPALTHPEAHDEVTQMFVDVLVAREDPAVAGLLRAMERLAHPPLRDQAREAVATLAERGIVSPVDAQIGGLRAQECAIYETDGGDLGAIGFLLGRPDEPDLLNAAMAFVDPRTGGLVEADVLDPYPPTDALRRFNFEMEDGTRRLATPQEALPHFEKALASAEGLPEDRLVDVAILERALTGEEMRLPRPPVYLDEDEEEEEEGFAGRLVDQMMAEGVDPTDPEALAAWMEDFNARPYEERRAITGELGGKRAARGDKRKKRRNAKAARRRNRRR